MTILGSCCSTVVKGCWDRELRNPLEIQIWCWHGLQGMENHHPHTLTPSLSHISKPCTSGLQRQKHGVCNSQVLCATGNITGHDTAAVYPQCLCWSDLKSPPWQLQPFQWLVQTTVNPPCHDTACTCRADLPPTEQTHYSSNGLW